MTGSALGPAPGSVLGPALMFDIGLIPSTVTIPVFGVITDPVAFVVINPYIMFYYGKVIIAKDLTSSKLYIKRTIWIERILFSNIIEA